MAQTYLFEHGIEDPRAGLGFIRVPLTARQIAIVNEACLDYVSPADIVVAGIQALEATAAAHAYAAQADVAEAIA